MSDLLEAPGANPGTLALPFETPRQILCPAGLSLAELVDELVAQDLLKREWTPWLDIYIDAAKFEPQLWKRVRPLPGKLVSIRARAGWQFVVQLAINLAISTAVNALVQAFVGGGAQSQSFEQLVDISASRNEVALYRKVNAVLGQFRVFPLHAAKPYTVGLDEKVKLYMLLCWGLGPVTLNDVKVGDTPIGNLTGVNMQHKLKPGDPWPTIYAGQVDQQDGPGLMEFADGWANIVSVSTNADKLVVELAYPEGMIFYSSDGSVKSFGVDLRIRYREVGSTDWLDFQTGAVAPEGHLYDLDGYTRRKPFRMNFEKLVPRGQYEVGVKRAMADDPGPKGKNAFQWTKLTAYTFDPPLRDDNLAVTAIEIDAGDQLTGQVDLFNGMVYRVAPRWDADAEAFSTPGETSNPAELLRWVVSGPGAANPRDPATEIDDAALGAWAELCHERGWRCDFELRSGAGQDDLMNQIAQCGRASWTERNGKLTVVIDDVQDAPVQLFTPRNSWGFRSQRRFAAATHGLRLQFNNAEQNYARDEMYVYYPGYDEDTADGGRIVTVPVNGKVWPAEVRAAGLRIIAEDLLRPENYSFRCDFENLACAKGKRIAVAHSVIAVGRKSARIKSLTLNGGGTHVTALTLDEEIEQTAGDTYGLVWRRQSGASFIVENAALTNMANGKGRVVTLAAATPIASAPLAGDLVTFGDAFIETLDVTITNIVRATDLEAEISGMPYNSAIADGDVEGLTVFSDDTAYSDQSQNQQQGAAWSSNVSNEAFPAPPAPEVVNVNSTASGNFVDYTFPIATAWRVREVEGWWRHVTDDGVYELARKLPAESRLANFPADERGETYAAKLVAIDARGRRTESVEFFFVSSAVTAPFTGTLTQSSAVVATAADGSGGEYGAAGGRFQLFLGETQLDPIVSGGEAAATFTVVSATAGLSISIDAEGNYTVASLANDAGQAVLRASRQGFTLDLVYSIAKAKAGAPGAPSTPPSGFVATITVPASSSGVNLRALADGAGYTGLSDATIVFNLSASAVGAPGAPNGGTGIDTGDWPVDDYAISLTLNINSGGKGYGGGGRGGAGGSVAPGAPGANGGDALYCRAPIDVVVGLGGELKGGCAGGGGGGGARINIFHNDFNGGGGGGGGGAPNGPHGAGGQVNGSGDGADGGDGATGGGGVGGAGGVNNAQGGAGGAGGSFGTAATAGANGLSGSTKWNGAAAGVAGYAVRKNGHVVNVSGAGVIVGTVG